MCLVAKWGRVWWCRLEQNFDSIEEVVVEKLKGSQRKFLRGLAHSLKPIVFIGKQGVVPTVIKAIRDALETHELIKLSFVDFKEKSQKEEISARIEEETSSECVGMIGHQAIFYRQNQDPKKRKIEL
jgi:RNA-binding protein